MEWRHLMIVMPIIIFHCTIDSELYDPLLSLMLCFCQWYEIVRKQKIKESEIDTMEMLYERYVYKMINKKLNTFAVYKIIWELCGTLASI